MPLECQRYTLTLWRQLVEVEASQAYPEPHNRETEDWRSRG